MCGGLIFPFLTAYQTMMPMRQPKLRMKKSWMNLSVAMRRPNAWGVCVGGDRIAKADERARELARFRPQT